MYVSRGLHVQRHNAILVWERHPVAAARRKLLKTLFPLVHDENIFLLFVAPSFPPSGQFWQNSFPQTVPHVPKEFEKHRSIPSFPFVTLRNPAARFAVQSRENKRKISPEGDLGKIGGNQTLIFAFTPWNTFTFQCYSTRYPESRTVRVLCAFTMEFLWFPRVRLFREDYSELRSR